MLAPYRQAVPYSRFAATYDRAVGVRSFHCTRRAFCALVRRYGVRFDSAVDLGCGTGLFAGFLNRCWGIPVFAVDRSAEMLGIAARNCRGPGVRLLRQDIRRLRLPWPVDLATANFDTLNHLVGDSELRRAFRRIAGNLRPGGHLFFDLITTCAPLGGGRRELRRLSRVARRFVQEVRWEPERRTLTVSLLLRGLDSRPPTLEIHRERAYRPADVARWLAEAGFILRGVHDAATLRVAAGCPARIFVLARKSRDPGRAAGATGCAAGLR